MRSNYKRLGDYIERCDEFNEGMQVKDLLGISNNKYFQKSHTNIIGIDLTKYRIVRNHQFAFNRATTRNGDKISIALRRGGDCIVSPSYRIFKSRDENVLNSEYLMMWFNRPEFDRYARFKSHGSAHEFFDWEEMCEVDIPIPSQEKQLEIVKEYNIIQGRIKLNKHFITKLGEIAQTIYKQWFVDFEFPNENGLQYKSSGGEMFEGESGQIPMNWKVENLKSYCLKIGSGSTPKGGKENYHKSGTSLVRSMNVHDFVFSPEDLAFIDDRQAKSLEGVSLKAQDILLNITGVSVARCCIVPEFVLPARVNQHVMIIRPKIEFYLSNYLMCLLCYSDNKTKLLGISQSGSTREAITKSEIDEFEVLIPNKIIAKRFDEHANKIRKMIEIKVLNVTKLNELKNILLSKMTKVEMEKELTQLI